MEFVYKILSVVTVPFFFSLFLLFGVAQVLMILNRKPGVKLFQARFLFDPFTMQYRGRFYLTERGLFWRNVSWASGAIFMLGLGAMILFLE